MSAMREDWNAAYALVGIMIGLKVILGLIIFVFMPIRESASLYTVVHLSAIFGLIPLIVLFGGGALFWWRVVRLRMRRRELLRLEWQLEEDEPQHNAAT